ncbi:MAG: PhnD/SsuA/transferrin family substrate-binding protein, partial [Candidatus Latescibacterota bacterium]
MPKTTQAILPVFFQQADACLVPKTDFETAVQLNPQLGINLQILAESPGFKNSIACLQKEYYNNYAGLITEALKTIGQTEQGKQFFTLFRVNTMQRFDEAHLDNVKNLMQTYQTLNQNKQLKKEK